MPLTGPEGEQLTAVLARLRDALDSARLPLLIPDVEPARLARREMLDQLDDYVLPRLRDLEAPLLTVVGGSTGAGKSTLVNSLVGERVTEPGVLRPTTRSPVLVHHPADAHWFTENRILPGLERTTSAATEPGTLQLVASLAIPPGLALLDAPDVDSVEEQNRLLAAQLLHAADLWLFVTSAARYADQVPWEYLRHAADRSAAVAIVLDRTAPDAAREVSTHLARMLSARGLRDSPLFVVLEGEVDDAGLLPSAHVRDIRAWLSSLAHDGAARGGVIRQTLEGAIRQMSTRAYQVADACHDQTAIAARLSNDVQDAYRAAMVAIDRASADGSLLRGEVLARWQEFVGTGELLNSLESKVSWLRDRVSNAVKGQPQQARRVSAAVEAGLQTLIWEHADAAAERADAAWRAINAGRELLDGTEGAAGDLSRSSPELRRRTEAMIRDWQEAGLELIRAEGAAKRSTARYLAYGVQGLGVALAIVVFASSEGEDGTTPGTGNPAALLGQKLLEAVFGENAARRLAAAARADLQNRLETLLASESQRFTRLLDAQAINAGAEEELREGARGIDDIRFALGHR